MQASALLVAAIAALVAVAFVPALGADGDVGVTYRVESAEEGTVRVTATFHAPNATLRVSLPDGASDVAADGFVPADGKHDYRLDGPATATLAYTVAVADPTAAYGRGTAATDSWALFRRHRVEPDVVHGPGVATVDERYADDWNGVAGADIAYWGPHEVREREVNGQQLRLVVPATANVSAGRALDAVAGAAASLRVGARDDTVTVFVADDPVRRGGLTSGWVTDTAQDLWVNDASPLDSPNDVWTHEYVHTRQSYVESDELSWFREASAEYYGALFAYRQGRTSFASFHDYLESVGTTSRETLAAPSSWRSNYVPYAKGARVAAALDARIREASDGGRSLQDVLAAMNAHDDRVTYEDFERFVADAAGESLDEWLDRYVQNGGVPPLPEARSLYAPADGDDDSDLRGVRAAAPTALAAAARD